ncbi:MAG: hypothetical protein NVSMB39_1560 [Candidatus Saccharimonadales bacterium]
MGSNPTPSAIGIIMKTIFGIALTRRIIIGLGLIYLSGLGYAAEILIPFTRLPHKGAIFTIVLIITETSFVTGIAAIGKPVYRELKYRLINYIQQRKNR